MSPYFYWTNVCVCVCNYSDLPSGDEYGSQSVIAEDWPSPESFCLQESLWPGDGSERDFCWQGFCVQVIGINQVQSFIDACLMWCSSFKWSNSALEWSCPQWASWHPFNSTSWSCVLLEGRAVSVHTAGFTLGVCSESQRAEPAEAFCKGDNSSEKLPPFQETRTVGSPLC